MAKKKGNRRLKKLRWMLLGLFVAGAAFVWATNATVLSSGNGRIYTEAASVPNERVALLLGAAPTIDGMKNAYFEMRMNAAAKLYRAGKVTKLLVSGDNHIQGYDEPTAMKQSLMQRGVPERDIVPDYAGFRTLDSIVRAKKVFGVDRCVIVTDDFHLPRALYIAEHEGVDAVGFQTTPLPASVSPWTHVREIGARSLVWIDIHLLCRQPHFLGPKQTI